MNRFDFPSRAVSPKHVVSSATQRWTWRPEWTHVALYAACTLALTLLFRAYVPYSTDEFVHYRLAFCSLLDGDSFVHAQAGCDRYELALPFTSLNLPLRSVAYVGSFPSLYALPALFVWPGVDTVRWLGAAFIVLQAFVLARVFRMPMATIFAGLIGFFPYFFQHMVDTGPVAFQTTSVFLLFILCKRWCERPTFLDAILAGVVVFLGIWTKLVYFVLLPGIALACLPMLIDHRATWWERGLRARTLKQLALGLAVGAGLTAAFLLSYDPADPDVMPLLAEIDRGGRYAFTEYIERFGSLPAVKSLANPLVATQRVFEVDRPSWAGAFYAILAYCFVPFALLLCVWRDLALWRRCAGAFMLYLAFVLTLILITQTKIAWAVHHTVLAFPFLILSFLSTLQCLGLALQRTRLPLIKLAVPLVAFFAIMVHAFASFVHQASRPFDTFPQGGKIWIARHHEIYACDRGGPTRNVLTIGELSVPQESVARQFSLLHDRDIAFRLGEGSFYDLRMKVLPMAVGTCVPMAPVFRDQGLPPM